MSGSVLFRVCQFIFTAPAAVNIAGMLCRLAALMINNPPGKAEKGRKNLEEKVK